VRYIRVGVKTYSTVALQEHGWTEPCCRLPFIALMLVSIGSQNYLQLPLYWTQRHKNAKIQNSLSYDFPFIIIMVIININIIIIFSVIMVIKLKSCLRFKMVDNVVLTMVTEAPLLLVGRYAACDLGVGWRLAGTVVGLAAGP
jgi:hypothetical protein